MTFCYTLFMKFICGPMATISHPAFRILIEKFGGCDEYFTEMINASSLLNAGPYEKYYIDPSPVPEKIVWQLTGKDAEPMARATEILCKLPGIGIDINMGCAAPDIYKTGAGIGWMLKPKEETFAMVKDVASVIKEHNINSPEEKKRFSIKLRLGDDNFKDEDFFDFCNGLAELGVELFTLHPRTKKEKLARPARYEYCQKLAEVMHSRGVKVYLNGNVKDYNAFNNAVTRAPSVDGVMISRWAVEHPWIFSTIRDELEGTDSEHTIDMLQLALDYITDIEMYQPVDFWKTRLQRFFAYYSSNFLFGHYAQTEFLNATDNEDLRKKLYAFFEKCPEERFRNV